MTNSIILAVVLIILFLAIRSAVKKSREKQSCCSSGTYKARPRRLTSVAETRIMFIDGMSCQHCVNRVMEALNSLEGVSATVNLKKGTASISLEHPIKNDLLKVAVEKAGYTVTDLH